MSALNSIFGALKYVPATVARKALEKVNPKFGNYFSSALSYGVDANRALDFLMDRFESSAQQTHKDELEKGASQGTLRPDEMASRSQMQNASIPGKIVKGAASIGIGALAGGIPGAASQAVSQVKPQPQEKQQESSPREKSLKRHAEMNKKKKLIDQLSQEFEQEYGQGNVSASGFPSAAPGTNANDRITQGTPGGGKNELLMALQEVKSLLG